MLMDLPDFDYLKSLAVEEPEALEALRQFYCQQVIDEAPERLRMRLEGLMFRINMEARRSKNSMHSCIKISQMMFDSFLELQDALQKIHSTDLPYKPSTHTSADVISLADKKIALKIKPS